MSLICWELARKASSKVFEHEHLTLFDRERRVNFVDFCRGAVSNRRILPIWQFANVFGQTPQPFH